MLWRDSRFRQLGPNGEEELHVRNQPGDYKCTLARADVLAEVRMVLDKQIALGSQWIDEKFAERYLAILSGQRDFDEGPGGNSPYGGAQIEKMLGTCSFEPTEKRAVKASFTFEYFRLLQDVNHIRLVRKGYAPENLTPEQREIVIQAAMTTPDLTYGQLRKKLGNGDWLFNNLYYGKKSIEEQEKKKLGEMQSYHKLRKAMNKVAKGSLEAMPIRQRDEIAYILTIYKNDDHRKAALRAAGIPEAYDSALLPLSYNKTGNLSIKAMQALIPYLEKGMTYDKAVAQIPAYQEKLRKGGERKVRLSVYDLDEPITNPVVYRAISQTVKVVNAIVREYGPPERVRIELARELGKSHDERNKQTKRQEDNRKANEDVKNRF